MECTRIRKHISITPKAAAVGEIRRHSKNIEEQYCGNVFFRKPRDGFRKWDMYSAVWILHQMSATEILVKYGQTMLEEALLHVYVVFKRGHFSSDHTWLVLQFLIENQGVFCEWGEPLQGYSTMHR